MLKLLGEFKIAADVGFTLGRVAHPFALAFWRVPYPFALFVCERVGLESRGMVQGLKRIHGGGDWHFITCSCYRRQPLLGSGRRRDLFLKILEEVRVKYDFIVAGYVVMPEHFHLLISEPRSKIGTPSLVMQVLKQRVSRRCRKKTKPTDQMTIWEKETLPAFWQRRYYDFNVYSKRKQVEKLRYMHRNPVKRKLVESPELWRWSSFRHYWFGEEGAVKIGG